MNNKSTNSTKSQKQERTKKSEDLWSEDDLVHQAFSNRVGGWYIHRKRGSHVVSLRVNIGSLPTVAVACIYLVDF
jgi:hypothetical protein